jgi:hypothetical protein
MHLIVFNTYYRKIQSNAIGKYLQENIACVCSRINMQALLHCNQCIVFLLSLVTKFIACQQAGLLEELSHKLELQEKKIDSLACELKQVILRCDH